MELTQARVRELFDYREDGVLVRKIDCGGFKAGRPVGCLHKASGYLVVRIDRRLYKVHRVIFLWHHGWLPPEVDHRDADGLNNRIENLRPATRSQNASNRRAQSNNSSGYKGVYYHKQNGYWCAEINGKHLGVFMWARDAHAAYVAAAEAMHGEFARAA